MILTLAPEPIIFADEDLFFNGNYSAHNNEKASGGPAGGNSVKDASGGPAGGSSIKDASGGPAGGQPFEKVDKQVLIKNPPPEGAVLE